MVPTYPGLFKARSTVSRLLHVYTPLLMDMFSSTEFLTDTCNCRTTKSGAPLEIYCFHDYHTFQSADHLCPFPEKQMQSSPINCLCAAQHSMSIHIFDNSTNFNYNSVQINSYNNLAHPKQIPPAQPIFPGMSWMNSKDCGHTSLQS
jgi:hypothetical protein